MAELEHPQPRLTELARGGGCACKLPASELSALLGAPVASRDPRVLVGNETLDDAACFAVGDDGTAIVQTVDFFTPIVDDPLTFGRIAATNAISDIYAMGATPLFALALGGFPAELPRAVVAAILRGGQDAAAAAGIAILGGHTIVAPEPIYGLTVTGTVQVDAVWRNGGAREGDVLVLTKALGTGVIANALQAGSAPQEAIAAAVASMTTLNRDAANALRAHVAPTRSRMSRGSASSGTRASLPLPRGSRSSSTAHRFRCSPMRSSSCARDAFRAARAAIARRPTPTRGSTRPSSPPWRCWPATPRHPVGCSPRSRQRTRKVSERSSVACAPATPGASQFARGAATRRPARRG